MSLTCATGGASIYYTLDSSNPTKNSTLYSGPIPITAAVTIKARAYADAHTASDTLSAPYTVEAEG